jgi:hypothetical protein
MSTNFSEEWESDFDFEAANSVASIAVPTRVRQGHTPPALLRPIQIQGHGTNCVSFAPHCNAQNSLVSQLRLGYDKMHSRKLNMDRVIKRRIALSRKVEIQWIRLNHRDGSLNTGTEHIPASIANGPQIGQAPALGVLNGLPDTGREQHGNISLQQDRRPKGQDMARMGNVSDTWQLERDDIFCEICEGSRFASPMVVCSTDKESGNSSPDEGSEESNSPHDAPQFEAQNSFCETCEKSHFASPMDLQLNEAGSGPADDDHDPPGGDPETVSDEKSDGFCKVCEESQTASPMNTDCDEESDKTDTDNSDSPEEDPERLDIEDHADFCRSCEESPFANPMELFSNHGQKYQGGNPPQAEDKDHDGGTDSTDSWTQMPIRPPCQLSIAKKSDLADSEKLETYHPYKVHVNRELSSRGQQVRSFFPTDGQFTSTDNAIEATHESNTIHLRDLTLRDRQTMPKTAYEVHLDHMRNTRRLQELNLHDGTDATGPRSGSRKTNIQHLDDSGIEAQHESNTLRLEYLTIQEGRNAETAVDTSVQDMGSLEKDEEEGW